MPSIAVPTRAALLLRAVVVAAVGFALRLLVFNASDNAYLVPATGGFLLTPLAVPFAVAALLPAGRSRRIAAQIAVVLVWAVGGLFAALFVFYTVLIVGSVVAAPATGASISNGYRVMLAHILGAIITVPLVVFVSWRLFPRRAVPG